MDAKDILKMKGIKCECGCGTFEERQVLKTVSKLISPTGKDEIVPIPVMVCSKCGKVNKEFLKVAMGLTDDEVDVFLGNKEPAETKATTIIMDTTSLKK